MERALEMTVGTIAAEGKQGAKALFDRRVSELGATRQSDRVSVPATTFPSGLSSLSKIHGQEFPAAVIQVIAVVAGDLDGTLMPRDRAALVVTALDRLYRLWLWLEQEVLLKEHFQDGGVFDQRVEE